MLAGGTYCVGRAAILAGFLTSGPRSLGERAPFLGGWFSFLLPLLSPPFLPLVGSVFLLDPVLLQRTSHGWLLLNRYKAVLRLQTLAFSPGFSNPFYPIVLL